MKLSEYVIAIPSYNRADVIVKKTLNTLLNGKVPKNRIYIFVANKQEEKIYKNAVPINMYNKIIVGKLGIVQQRNFITTYFSINQYIVSMDDDVEEINMLRTPTTKLLLMKDIPTFLSCAYKILKNEGLYMWGVYPVRNPFFMKQSITTDLRFLIGGMYGFINRRIKVSDNSASKEDYELTILHYLRDGGIVRFNNITFKTKFYANGGLGSEQSRFNKNKTAALYLKKKYPKIVTVFNRKNGTYEIRLAKNIK